MISKIWHWIQHRLKIPHWCGLEFRGTPIISDDGLTDMFGEGGKDVARKCELITDHDVNWAGDGYYCSNCMLKFVPEQPTTQQSLDGGVKQNSLS